MMFEGEISDDLLMLTYVFIVLIVVYAITAIFFYVWNKKGKAYEARKEKQMIMEHYSPELSTIDSVNTNRTTHDQRSQNPT